MSKTQKTEKNEDMMVSGQLQHKQKAVTMTISVFGGRFMLQFAFRDTADHETTAAKKTSVASGLNVSMDIHWFPSSSPNIHHSIQFII